MLRFNTSSALVISITRKKTYNFLSKKKSKCRAALKEMSEKSQRPCQLQAPASPPIITHITFLCTGGPWGVFLMSLIYLVEEIAAFSAIVKLSLTDTFPENIAW